MYGPPLEAFHRGATRVTTPVTGHDEYVVHGWNGLVTEWDDVARHRAAARPARARPALLHFLRTNALATARGWPAWEQAGQFMAMALHRIAARRRRPRRRRAARDARRPARGRRDLPRAPRRARRVPARGPARRARQGAARRPRRRAALAHPARAAQRRPVGAQTASGSAALMAGGARAARRARARRALAAATARRCVRRARGAARVAARGPRAARAGAPTAAAGAAARGGRRARVPARQRRPHDDRATSLRGLEARGHACSLWVEDDEGRHAGGRRRRARCFKEFFGPLAGPCASASTGGSGADVAVATGWQTVHRVLRLPGVAARAYLVQDHEPEFYATSAERTWAEETYRLGLHCICASAVAGRAGPRALRRERDRVRPRRRPRRLQTRPAVRARDDLVRRLRARGHAAARGAARAARAGGAAPPPAAASRSRCSARAAPVATRFPHRTSACSAARRSPSLRARRPSGSCSR